MLFFLFASLVGYYHCVTSSPVKLANLQSSGAFSSFGFTVREEKASFYILLFHKKKLLSALDTHGITLDSIRLCGLPAFFYRYRKRVGAFLGVVVAIFLAYLSEQFVWQIDIVGNERLSDEQVLAILADEGVYEGAYIGKLDPLAVANRCVMKSDELSWMSVNIVGNCVEAVVVEYADRLVEELDDTPSNMVAKKSGIVRRVVLTSGVAAVKEGSVVSEGALLISGVNQLRNESYIYQPARGQVFAETLNEITVKKSIHSEEKVYTGEVLTEKSYIFFTKSKKISQDSGNLPASCDRIERKERVMLFGVIPLPIWIVRVEYRAFTYRELTLTEDEVKAAALSEAWRQIAADELISCEESYTFDGNEAVVTLRYRAIEDIAANLPLFETP